MKIQQLALALAFCLAVEAAPPPNLNRALEQLKQPKTRVKAIQTLSQVVYSLNNSQQRGQICAALLERLRLSKNPPERRQLAALLESYLSHEKTPALSFVKAEPLLLDNDDAVRHSAWLAFYQQASQSHLTPAQDDRLLELIQSKRPEIRKEALNWANEATQSRHSVVGQPQSELGKKALKIQLDLSNDPDTQIRNLAIYGCFQQLPYARHQVSLIAGQHLADSDGGIRSLVLDFLQQAALRDATLCQLQPVVLEHFRRPVATGNFPAVADAEANPPLDERYRLVLVAASMGPLPEDAWTYLREEAPAKVPFELLLNLARLQGQAARPLLAKIVTPQNFPLAADVLATCGLPDELVAPVVLELQSRHKKEAADQASQTASLILSLADRPQAAVGEAFLTSADPQIVAAAAYAVGRSQPQGAIARKAAEALTRQDWKIAFKGGTTMLAAVDRLRASQTFPLAPLQGTTLDVDLLLAWLLGAETQATPQFLEEFAQGSAISGRLDPGVGPDILALEMRWIAAHKAVACEPGLRRLLYHPDPGVREQAQETLTALGLKE